MDKKQKNHLERKNRIQTLLEAFTGLVLKPYKTLLDKDIEIYNANTSAKIAGKKADAINQYPTESEIKKYLPGSDPDNENIIIEFNNGGTYYKYALTPNMAPVIAHQVKQNWGNGIPPKVATRSKPANTQKESRNMQQYIMDLRSTVLSDEAERKKFETWIKLACDGEKNTLKYRCRKFILNRQNLEGVHYTWINPTAKFTPYSATNQPPTYKTATHNQQPQPKSVPEPSSSSNCPHSSSKGDRTEGTGGNRFGSFKVLWEINKSA